MAEDYNFDFLDDYINSVLTNQQPSEPELSDGSEYEELVEITDEDPIEEFTDVDEASDEAVASSEDDLTAMLLADDPFIPSSSSHIPNKAGKQGNISYKAGVDTNGLNSGARSIVSELSGFVGNLTITSGRRSVSQNRSAKGAKNSFHLTGDAVDLRPTAELNNFLSSREGIDYMRQRGYQVIDERNRKGHGAHWHLEPANRQFGGGVAITPRQQYVGLNDNSMDELIMPLDGRNTIRGLDSGHPVVVLDEMGNQDVLYGPEDTQEFYGNVYEKRLNGKK